MPLAALALSDAVLGFYPGFVWVYGSFVLIGLLGLTLRRRRTPVRIIATSLASSVLFFLITNFGEWLGPLYPHGLAGLWASYLAGIPFFRNTVVSDLVYSLAFFGVYDERRSPRASPARPPLSARRSGSSASRTRRSAPRPASPGQTASAAPRPRPQRSSALEPDDPTTSTLCTVPSASTSARSCTTPSGATIVSAVPRS